MKAKVKKSYEKNVNILVIVFLLTSLFIASIVLAEPVTPSNKVTLGFKQVETSLLSTL